MGEQRIRRRFSGHPPSHRDTSTPHSSAAGTRLTGAAPTPLRQRLANALTSAWGVLIVFPTLVLAVGGFLTWMAQDALRGSNLELARTRMGEQALLVSEHLGAAFGQADAVLSDLKSFVATVPSDAAPESVALPLKRLIYARPGVSYISLSYSDGTFEGAFVDEDGKMRFQVSRVFSGFTEERVYDYSARETLVLREVRKSNYDPRTRPFYRLALNSRGPVWTEPYAFARTGDTGITRAQAVRLGGPGEYVVITLDFDVPRLSPLLMRREAHAERPILFNDQGTILADPDYRLREGESAGGQLLNYRSLGDPVLTAFFDADQAQGSREFFGFHTSQGDYLAATARLDGHEGLDWSVAFVAPESTFLASLSTYKQRSYLIAAVALLIATLLSSGFAQLIVRVRKEAADARDAARAARKEARELGSYRLVEQLGVGGMGEVWRAEHRLLARQAAIKLIKTDEGAAAGQGAQERFRREAQSLASLRSRNTIELFDYGVTEDGTFFYVMELLDGLDLETLVNQDGQQSAARVVKLLIQACRSLGEAHAAGFVHRDVKPANIFVCSVADELDVVKVLDFGLVRSLAPDKNEGGPEAPSALGLAVSEGRKDDAQALVEGSDGGQAASSGPRLTRADHIMGTPEFIAPEQAVGGEVDGRSDIYALGCVAYWLLTGRTVFSSTSLIGQLTAHLTQAPPSLLELCDEPLPEALVRLLEQCLAKSPDQRPQSAHELMQGLLAIDREIGTQWEEREQGWWATYRVTSKNKVSIPPGLDASLAKTVVVDGGKNDENGPRALLKRAAADMLPGGTMSMVTPRSDLGNASELLERLKKP